MIDSPPFDTGESLYFGAPDGLRIHVRAFGPADSGATPIVCLPGLSRNSRDFLGLAAHFATEAKIKRRVYAFDFRGRGLSAHDRNWRNYNVPNEAMDVVAGLDALAIHHAIFVGTSRGGLVTMAMSAIRPGAIRAAVLNDIGPVIEGTGLTQIRLYLQKMPQPTDWADAIAIQKQVMGHAFTGFSEADWAFDAQARYRELSGRVRPDHDPNLVKTVTNIDLGDKLPEAWPQFDGLRPVPVMAIRGANSQLFSEKTLEAMAARHPNLTQMTVDGQGHAPMLHTAGIAESIESFVGKL